MAMEDVDFDEGELNSWIKPAPKVMNELVLELRIKNDETYGSFSRFITIFMYLYIFFEIFV